MNKTHKNKIITLLLGVLLVTGFLVAKANVTTYTPSITRDTFRNYTFFATSTNQVVTGLAANYATSTTNGTSTQITTWTDNNGVIDKGYFVVAGAKKLELYFGRGATSTNLGTSVFSVQTSPDGTNWYDYGKLVLASTTNQTLQGTVSITAATTTVDASMDLSNNNPYAVRCIVVLRNVLDGNNTCSATANF